VSLQRPESECKSTAAPSHITMMGISDAAGLFKYKYSPTPRRERLSEDDVTNGWRMQRRGFSCVRAFRVSRLLAREFTNTSPHRIDEEMRLLFSLVFAVYALSDGQRKKDPEDSLPNSKICSRVIQHGFGTAWYVCKDLSQINSATALGYLPVNSLCCTYV